MTELGDNFFRHEYGRLVAMLSRRVGVHNVEAVEDAVQFALGAALETWPRSNIPDNPSAWLFRVAHNHVLGELRRCADRAGLARQHHARLEPNESDSPQVFLGSDVRDDMLRMLFACCDASLPIEAQLVLALKVLCGFDVREIAARIFVSEANVYKRLARARRRLGEADFELDGLSPRELASRVPTVQTILYVLFTEGYLSSHTEAAIRCELCDEAIRLTHELAGHALVASPETFALLALMHLHLARMPARQDGGGGLLLLEEQDRSLWDKKQIATGLEWLARSAQGKRFSRYHAEAGIAAEHCLAPLFAETRWERIVENYALLEQLAPSALHTLNRAVALAEWKGPEAGLQLLGSLAPPSWLVGSYMWFAVLSDLHRRAGSIEVAKRHRASALDCAPSAAVHAALERRLALQP
jgi:RNA polymerase sigma-70 factor (ECF subfamily)